MIKQHFPSLEESWDELFEPMIRRYIRQHGPLSGIIPHIPLFEGSTFSISEEPTKQADDLQVASANLILEHQVVRETNLEGLKERLRKFANEMLASVEQGAIRSIGQQLTEAGQTIDSKGKPLGWEGFIAMLERMDWQFDPQGRWLLPTMFMAPEMLPSIQRILSEAAQDGTKIEQIRRLQIKKKAEFDDRESNRKLVE